MFGISGEHLLILGIVLLIFGPRRLPELGNTLGKAIRNFKESLSGVEEAKFHRIQDDIAKAAQPHAPNSNETPEAKATAEAQAPTEAKTSDTPDDPNRSGTPS
jgi:TatA/E family protein of Tat protein translocase